MEANRRDFIKSVGFSGIGLIGGNLNALFSSPNLSNNPDAMKAPFQKNQLGIYGPWAKGLFLDEIPSMSFRKDSFSDIQTWREAGVRLVKEQMGYVGLDIMPLVRVLRQFVYEGLICEEISYQLPYGNPTRAVILKPAQASGKLPAVLGLHCHGGNKFLGLDKISKLGDDIPDYVQEHHERYYGGMAWANELAKRGYVVMVNDAFAFGSRRVMLEDVPEENRAGIYDFDMSKRKNIDAYNIWASAHEHIMAKSLLSAGVSWPAVYLAEDQAALDVLASRGDVDSDRIGCAGLSGGGLRTVMLGGLDPRISCAIAVGFMTTWADFLLYKSYTHTWMTYIPLLSRELDFPEILALRAPRPTLVLNDIEDDLFTLEEMKKADQILADVFEKAGASDRYKCSFYPGPHKFDLDMQREAFDWFDTWLKV